MVRYHTGIVKLGVAITSEPLLCTLIPFAGKIDVFSLPGAHRLQFRDYPGGCNIPSNFEIYP
jgi:hypothetical protein